MRLWLDDSRPAPPGWVHCQTVEAAKVLLETGKVEDLSLDHDLGVAKPTGLDLCRWMADTGHWPTNKPTLHTANKHGLLMMRGTIIKYGPY